MRSTEDEPAALASSAALASPARRRVLGALERSGEPVEAAELAESIGVHVTTARFHLDQLVDAGVVETTTRHRGRRGRPRLQYALVDAVAARARDERSRDRLIDALAAALEGQGSETRARLSSEAGQNWAASLSVPSGGEAPTERLVRVLDELGFAPERVPEGLSLHACPFRDSARRHRGVICAVHESLIREVLAGDAPDEPDDPDAPAASDSRVEARLLPFAAPDRCLVALSAAR
ncbi:helix-turn-helix transcriptional regulator [Agromyces laixinhei]|uniref:helix-turn-helix transcriptional regulator n=1 Tax=Agromyces laixinhei TaxID=2585717 RepID=UPI0011177462|nr:helix-turn-helix domain-containing protein [Agromyces laixinhei]